MNRADHEWTRDHLAVHVAGGLSADERARLEAHVAGCDACRAEFAEMQELDGSMGKLFAPVRPEAGFEERVIRTLRAAPGRRTLPFLVGVAGALAAMLLLGFVGHGLMGAMDEGGVVVAKGRVPTFAFEGVESGANARAMDRDDLDLKSVLMDEPAIPGAKLPHSDNAGQMKGESKDALRSEAGGFRGRQGRKRDIVSTGGGDGREQRKLDDRNAAETYYSYVDNAPAAPPASKAEYFKPVLEAAGRGEIDKKVEKEKLQKGAKESLAKADFAISQQPPADPKSQPAPSPVEGRKIIRSGEMEFEIEGFDSTVANITKIAGEEGGFIATVNSEKLPNGKVRGTVVLRVPPDRLDTLILKLRALGDLKSQRIGSEDVTKLYTDMDSRLRAARTMEARLIEIIKTGKGEIKDLLAAEKELGEWRTKIEVLVGEMKYYDNLISLSTLTLTLYEKEIRSPFGVIETERVQMGLEVEDVEKAHQDALKAVADAKGRVTRSELKQHSAGQYNATVHFEIAPDAAGPIRDRLKQLGNVARLDVDRVQATEGGSGKVGEVKVKRNDTQFFISIYNLANVAPREMVHLNLACIDAEESYKAILKRVEDAKGRVVTSSLNRQKGDQTTGAIQFEVKAADAEAVLMDIRKAKIGEVMHLVVTENPDAANVTRSKRGFNVGLYALGTVQPRETTAVTLAAQDVPASYRKLLEAVQKAEGRILASNLNEQDRYNVTGQLNFEARRDRQPQVEEAMRQAGVVYSSSSSRAQDAENVVDSKTNIQVTLINLARIPPRETHQIAVEVADVDNAVAVVEALGRNVDADHSRDASGRKASRIVVDVPLRDARTAAEKVKALGPLRVQKASKDNTVPDSELAVARLEVTVSNPDPLVPSDAGPWVHIKKGLSAALVAVSWALMLVMVGLVFVLPLGLLVWAGWKLYRKLRAKPSTA